MTVEETKDDNDVHEDDDVVVSNDIFRKGPSLNRLLTTHSSFSSSASSTTSRGMLDDDNRRETNLSSSSSSLLLFVIVMSNVLLSFIIFAIGFHLRSYWKSYLLPTEDTLRSRVVSSFQTMTSSGDIVVDFRYNQPVVEPETIPGHVLHSTCTHLPIVLVFLLNLWTNGVIDAMSGLSGVLTALGCCELFTHVLKYYVLRPRPNFLSLCEFAASAAACTTESTERLLDSQSSFPSGHSSLSWCGMTYVVLSLLGKIKLQHQQQQQHDSCGGGGGTTTMTTKLRSYYRQWLVLVVSAVPWSWAAYIAASRVVDHWHHPSDVVAGSLLGFLCAAVPYHSIYPSVFAVNAGTSYLELAITTPEYDDAVKI